jgi:hypothetical protein
MQAIVQQKWNFGRFRIEAALPSFPAGMTQSTGN